LGYRVSREWGQMDQICQQEIAQRYYSQGTQPAYGEPARMKEQA
jgi:hypothetical protein